MVTGSLPLWERGLKLEKHDRGELESTSLPLWERGLKWLKTAEELRESIVAPLVGAWIEIALQR